MRTPVQVLMFFIGLLLIGVALYWLDSDFTKEQSFVCERISQTEGTCNMVIENYRRQELGDQFELRLVESANAFKRRGKGRGAKKDGYCSVQIRVANRASNITLYGQSCPGNVQAQTEREAAQINAFLEDPNQKSLVLHIERLPGEQFAVGALSGVNVLVGLLFMIFGLVRRRPQIDDE
ncbi:MAG: hypothetical protein H0U74_16475 [Bradymonadaceae bacterium]|nr:hypothetical protein [Lujinxingiaceae bacterium]